MVEAYGTLLWTMWLDTWGNSTIAALVLIIVFGALCAAKKYTITESTPVVLPVVFGCVMDGAFPMWISGMILIGVGTVWALFLLRISGLRG